MEINITNLKNMNPENFRSDVIKLTEALNRGDTLSHKVETQSLEILKKGDEQEPSREVLEDLREILMTAHEKGLTETLRDELAAIRRVAEGIIAAHPDTRETFREIPQGVVDMIMARMHPKEYNRVFQDIPENWRRLSPQVQIDAINGQRLPMKEALPGKTAEQMVDWIIRNRAHAGLEYADFSGVEDFDNACLEKLTRNCPNLKHLLLENTTISEDALMHLAPLKNLQSLNIQGCDQFEPDALKHLAPLKNLQSLNIRGCQQLEPDALKHLEPLENLQSLNMQKCDQIEPDALKHLEPLKNLQYLNIEGCDQLEQDALPESMRHLLIS